MTKAVWIHAERLFPGAGQQALRDHALCVVDGRIAAVQPGATVPPEAAPTRCAVVAPGFVDLQINGGGGVMFNDAPDARTIARMARAARSGGATHILPTFITAPGTAYRSALVAVADAIASGAPGILGLHLEGPFLSRARPGIHPAAAIRRLTADDVAALCGFAHPLLLTVAPEDQEPAHLRALAQAGVRLFAGHSDASADQIDRAKADGLCGITHLWNAMAQPTARAPGPVGAALTDGRLMAGIIADGIHVDPRNLALAARMMPGRLFLVSDAMATLDAPDAAFAVGGVPIRRHGARLVSADGTLAGAHLRMDDAVRTMLAASGLPVETVLDMASGVPARAMGLEDRLGRIAPGRSADLVCLDPGYRTRRVMVAGRWM